MTVIPPKGMTALVSRSEGVNLKYVDAAGKAGGEQRLLAQARKATEALVAVQFEKDGKVDQDGPGIRPLLATPRQPVDDKKQDASARFVGLMATIVELLGDAGLKSLESRISTLKSLSESVRQSDAALLAGYEAALAELEAALTRAGGTEQALEAARSRLTAIESTLVAAQARLSGLNPVDAGYDEALAARDAAQAGVSYARQEFNAAKTAHKGSLLTAHAANVKADELLKSLDSGGMKNSGILDAMRKQNLDAAGKMVLLMAMFSELIGEAAETRLDAQKAIATEIRDAQAATALKQAKDYEDQVRKAEESNRKMGCIGKVLGGVLTLVSVVGAVFTGGASLAIAGVGIALMAGDMIGKAITGTSFMEKAIKPLMDHVLSPIISAIGKALSFALEKAGLAADKAAMIGNVVGAIAGALLMVVATVVVSVVAKGAVSRIAPKLGEMIGNVVGKLVPDLLKDVGRSASSMLSQLISKVRSVVGLSSDAASLARYAARLEMSTALIQGAGSSAQSAMHLQTASHQAKAAELMSRVVVASSIVETVATWLEEQVQTFADAIQKQSKVIEQMAAEMLSHIAKSQQMAQRI